MEESMMCCFSIRRPMTGTGILSTRNTTASTSKISIALLSLMVGPLRLIERITSLGPGEVQRRAIRQYEVMGVRKLLEVHTRRRMSGTHSLKAAWYKTNPGSVPRLQALPG